MDDDTTFISHLVELRSRLIRALLVLFLGFLPCAFFARELYSFLAFPLLEKLPQGGQMIATEVVTPFFIPMKVALMVAFLVTLPHTLYQLWAFVAPGLYSHEKRLFLPLVFISSLLFFTGMAFAYFAVLPLVFEFIVYFAPEGVAVMTDISEYLGFVLSMFLAFGITFEVPVFVLILIRTGLVSIEKNEICPPLCTGRCIHHRCDFHTTRCHVADLAGGPFIPALRAGHHPSCLVDEIFLPQITTTRSAKSA